MSLALLTVAPHSGVVKPRTHPELSDIALFVAAVLAVWLTRRALRRRRQKDDRHDR